jgi:hypothetical protein
MQVVSAAFVSKQCSSLVHAACSVEHAPLLMRHIFSALVHGESILRHFVLQREELVAVLLHDGHVDVELPGDDAAIAHRAEHRTVVQEVGGVHAREVTGGHLQQRLETWSTEERWEADTEAANRENGTTVSRTASVARRTSHAIRRGVVRLTSRIDFMSHLLYTCR